MGLTPIDEKEIRAVLDEYMSLVNEHQAAACSECFDTDGDLLALDGTFLRGTAEIRQYYEKMLDGSYSEFRVENISTLGMRSLGPDLALLDATWEVYAGAHSGEPVVTPIGSFVLKNREGGWRISAARLMVPLVPGK